MLEYSVCVCNSTGRTESGVTMQDSTNRTRVPAASRQTGAKRPTGGKRKATRGRRFAVSTAKLTPKRIAWRVGLSVLTLIAVVLVGALGAGLVAFKGPSKSLGDLLTVTMLETSALKFIPRIYYSQAEVDEIIARNEVTEADEDTDTSMIVIASPDSAD